MPTSDPHESIIEAARAGADWAWERLVKQIDGPLRGYITRLGAVDVDDIVGETWLHVARGLRHFNGDETAFRSWVFMIAHHRMVDERRRFHRKPSTPIDHTEIDEFAPAVRSTESEAIDRISDREVQEILNLLPPEQREVILLRFFAGFGINEIGRIVGKRPGAVSTLQRRALRRLERILGQSRTFSERRDGNGVK